MVVVALIGTIASIAVISMRRGRSTGDADAWASTLRNMAAQAHARAISTKQVYMMDLHSTSLVTSAQWCQVTIDSTVAACTLTSCPTASVPTACPNGTSGAENGSLVYAPADARIDSVLTNMDVWLPSLGYAAPVHTGTLPDQVFFGPLGTADSDLQTVIKGQGAGFTIYVKASNNVPGTATSANEMRRRVVIYGPSGRARIIDNWQ
jgi:Tfp pilus assembly protein FimT